ncbi:uncharacterized protein [Malus domestica]|uniref:uncharacterized protein n=1 Tax=Malus domestica TaxID=3750 RepID=UPI003974AB33
MWQSSSQSIASSSTCPYQDNLKAVAGRSIQHDDPRLPQEILTNKKGKWPDELPGCLWAYRTTKRRATGETYFPLAFGSEAIIHPNVIKPSIIALVLSIEQNSKKMTTNLDLVEDKREQTITCIAAYQQQLISNYNKRAKIRQFQPEDLILRKTFITARREGSKKMDPIWEGPYKISRVGGKSNYTIATMKR